MKIIQQFPPGHFYSPLPDLQDIKNRENEIWRVTETIGGVELNKEEHLKLFLDLEKFFKELPFTEQKGESIRYDPNNTYFSHADPVILYSLIRHLKPRRIIEVGSGYSSAVLLDTNELHFNNTISCTFIEPYPQLLESLITNEDKKRIETIPVKLQDVELSR